MATFHLRLLSPDRSFFDGEATEVVFSTPEGRLGVMAGHAPLVAAVAEGVVEINSGGERKIAAVGQGFAEISGDLAEFFLDTAEWADEIDVLRAQDALHRAEMRKRGRLVRIEQIRTQAAMSRALARLKAASLQKEEV
jgi:F-type H+-transporting ATPase subunit epsilon